MSAAKRNGVHHQPAEPNVDLKLSWRRLDYSVKVAASEHLRILHDVSGTAKTGSLTAIMGSSGSGKTTLLGSIAQKIEGVRGAVMLNGRCVNNEFMKEISGFLPQHELGTECLTAMEHMQFVCALKLSAVFDKEERNNRINNLLSELSLEHCASTMLSRLSGGERKRLFLAAELLTDPSVIFCDEPTTGLDSYNAYRVVEVLKQLAVRGKVILASVHQPSSQVFDLFTHVLLLSRGHLVYHGPSGEISTFFASFNLMCPESFNAAEFYVKQISVVPDSEDTCLERVKMMSDKFASAYPAADVECTEFVYAKKRKKCPMMTQLVWLLWRAMIEYKRCVLGRLTHAFIIAITAAVVAASYSASRTQNSSTVQDTSGILYLTVSELMFTSTYSVLNTFPQEIPIILREKDLYSAFAYYVVKTCSLMPAVLLYPSLFVTIIFLVYEFSGGVLLSLSMIAVMAVAVFTAMAYGLMMSAAFESPEYMTLVIVPLDHVLMLMAGIFINVHSLPYVIWWLNYISHFYYAFELLSILQWEHVSHIPCPDISMPCVQNGTEVLQLAGFSADNFNLNIGALVFMACVMHVFGYFGILRRRKKYSPL